MPGGGGATGYDGGVEQGGRARRTRPFADRHRGTRPSALRMAFLIVGAALAAAGCTGTPAAVTPRSTSSPPPAGSLPTGRAASLQDTFVEVIRRVRPSVVQIETDTGLGSGVVFDDRGDIVTNAHVVGGASRFVVTLANGRRLEATLVDSFVPDDLAVVRVSGATGLAPATFADSSRLAVGDIVLAIGNPLGLQSSVTEGIVSAVGRTVSEGNGVVLPDVIQTSAAINPGNSGGALVDLAGNVVGIPTLAATDPQLGGGAAPGIGFAIPSNLVRDIAGQIVAQGRVVNSHRAYLGVARLGTAVDDTGNPVGVVVGTVIPGGPADRAGIHPGDVLTQVAGHDTPTPEALAEVLAQLQPGQQVSVRLTRDDGEHSVSVTLGQYPGS